MVLNIAEFESKKDSLRCRGCGHVGLVAIHNANNNGTRAGCPNCGHKNPILGVQWLAGTSHELRRPAGEPTGPEVWASNGDFCFACGITRQECAREGIGLHCHHAWPYRDREMSPDVELPTIPCCSTCHWVITGLQDQRRRLRKAFTTIEEDLARLREKQAALDRARSAGQEG